MLSLLSLLIASGTVLRADTDPWTPSTYPDPRTNTSQCNTTPGSTVCDPDHLLSDQWRANIDESVRTQVERLRNTDIHFVDDAPAECLGNETEPLQMFVLLARRIQTANITNATAVTTEVLTTFGNGLAEELGLQEQPCKNFLLLVVVETAHEAYVRTGSHLKVPTDLMERVFNRSTNLFSEKNYMEVLNKIILEIGDEMVTAFAPPPTEPTPDESSGQDATTEQEVIETTQASVTSTIEETTHNGASHLLLYIGMVFIFVAAMCILVAVALLRHRHSRVCCELKPTTIGHFMDYTSAYQRSPVVLPNRREDEGGSIGVVTNLNSSMLTTDASEGLARTQPLSEESRTL